jgi:uncharacterized protein YdiU (UPF0061 family)
MTHAHAYLGARCAGLGGSRGGGDLVLERFAATQGHLQPMHQLLAAIRRPFDQDPQQDAYAEPAPAAQTAAYQTFCGT